MEESKSLKKQMTVKQLAESTDFVTDTKYYGEIGSSQSDIPAGTVSTDDKVGQETLFEANDAKKALDKAVKQDNIYEAGGEHKRFVRLSNALSHSGFDGKDSPEMADVKRSLAGLTTALLGEVDLSSADILENVKTVEEKYAEVIRYCDTYIQKKNPLSLSGKARKRMVEELRERCNAEKDMLLPTVHDLQTEMKKTDSTLRVSSFNEVLFYLRATKCTDYGDKEEGGELSDVHKVSYEEGQFSMTGFFSANSVRSKMNDEELIAHGMKSLSGKKGELKTDQGVVVATYKELYEYAQSILQEIEAWKKDSPEHADEIDKLKSLIFLGFKPESDAFPQECADAIRAIDGYTDSFVRLILESRDKHSMVNMARMVLNDDSTYVKENLLDSIPKIHRGASMSDRNVATSRIAELLGVQSVIAKSRTALLVKDGKMVRGNLMDKAEGISYEELLETAVELGMKIQFSTSAVSDAQKLQLMDYICGQTDRHTQNYFVTYHSANRGRDFVIDHVIGIDNDCSFGELKSDDMLQGRRYCTELEDKDGKFKFTKFDDNVVASILALQEEDLTFLLSDLDITKSEMEDLWERVNTLQNHLVDTSRARVKPTDKRFKGTVMEVVGDYGLCMCDRDVMSMLDKRKLKFGDVFRHHMAK